LKPFSVTADLIYNNPVELPRAAAGEFQGRGSIMHNEILTVSALFLPGMPNSSIADQLSTLPQVRLLGQTNNLEDFIRSYRAQKPDLIIVDLNETIELPNWLEDLTNRLPHTPMMLCSRNQAPEFLIRAMQLGVREFLPLPLVPADLEAALGRVLAAKKKRHGPEPGQGRLVAVTGLKGGVGVTSVAVNLAVALAEIDPERVVLVDLARPFADVASFLNQPKKTCLLDLIQNQDHLDPSFMMKILQPHKNHIAVLQGCPNFQTIKLVDFSVLDKVWANLRLLFDWIVVDLGHWLDEWHVKTAQEADHLLLLTELTVPDLHNLRQLWALFPQWGLERAKVKVLVNRYHRGNGLGLEDLEKIQKQPVFFTLPSDYKSLSESINHGVPLVEAAPRSKLYRSLRELAEELARLRGELTSEDAALPRSRRRFLFF
jgi:pilus assembly protein CpaE